MYHVKFVEADNNHLYKGEKCISDLVYYVMNPEKVITEKKRVKGSNSPSSGCSPFPFPLIYENNPEYVAFLMKTNIICFGNDFNDVFRHRIISFHASELVLPKDLELLGRNFINFYSKKGFIACYGLHKDTYEYHLHILVNTTSYVNGHRMNLYNEYNDVHGIIKNWYKSYMDCKLAAPEVVEEYSNKIFGDDCLEPHLVSLSSKEQISIYKEHCMKYR